MWNVEKEERHSGSAPTRARGRWQTRKKRAEERVKPTRPCSTAPHHSAGHPRLAVGTSRDCEVGKLDSLLCVATSYIIASTHGGADHARSHRQPSSALLAMHGACAHGS